MASILLDTHAWKSLAIIATLKAGCHTVVIANDDSVFGLEGDDERFEPAVGAIDPATDSWVEEKPAGIVLANRRYELRGRGGVRRTIANRGVTRITHAMSGRTI